MLSVSHPPTPTALESMAGKVKALLDEHADDGLVKTYCVAAGLACKYLEQASALLTEHVLAGDTPPADLHLHKGTRSLSLALNVLQNGVSNLEKDMSSAECDRVRGLVRQRTGFDSDAIIEHLGELHTLYEDARALHLDLRFNGLVAELATMPDC